MLCEKCHRRQTEWGTVCEECEKEQASIDRKADIVRHISRLKWYALWMAGELAVLWGLLVLIANMCGMSIVWTLGILGLMLLCLVIPLYEWCLWRGYAARIDKGELQQVAYELTHSPKGAWKRVVRRKKQEIIHRPKMIGGTAVYESALRELYGEWLALEMLADGEE